MKAKFKSPFTRRNKVTGLPEDRFSYVVSGTAEELAEFKRVRGQYYKEDDNGQPLLTSQQFVGNEADVKFTFDKQNVFFDNANQKQLKSLANQFNGQLGAAMANKVADLIIAQATAGTRASNASVETPAPAVEATADQTAALDE